MINIHDRSRGFRCDDASLTIAVARALIILYVGVSTSVLTKVLDPKAGYKQRFFTTPEKRDIKQQNVFGVHRGSAGRG